MAIVINRNSYEWFINVYGLSLKKNVHGLVGQNILPCTQHSHKQPHALTNTWHSSQPTNANVMISHSF